MPVMTLFDEYGNHQRYSQAFHETVHEVGKMDELFYQKTA
jgi:hypothetical protein